MIKIAGTPYDSEEDYRLIMLRDDYEVSWGEISATLGRSVQSVIGRYKSLKKKVGAGKSARVMAYREGKKAKLNGEKYCRNYGNSFGVAMAWCAGWNDADIELGNSVIAGRMS